VSHTIVAIRPEPGLSATIAAGRNLGLEIAGIPLSQVEPIAWEPPDSSEIDALLIGSANAIRHGGTQLSALTHLPAYAVGKATENELVLAAFHVAAVGEGGLQSVLDQIPTPNRLLRLAGEERISLELPQGITMIERIVYRVVEHPLSETQMSGMGDNPLILLHSAGSASHFAAEIDRVGLDRSAISLAALGPRIAEAAGDGWSTIHIADRPNDAELLAMVKAILL
jgi:uroporphyrinogen-III synthase